MVPCTKIIHGADLLGLFLEYADKFFADDLSLRLRLCHTGQLVIVTLLRIDTDKIQLIRTVRSEYCLYLIALILAKQTMIYKYTGQLLANCLGQQIPLLQKNPHHQTVHRALCRRRSFHEGLSDRILNERIHLPVAAAAAHVVYEIAEHLLAFYRMKNFRMELYRHTDSGSTSCHRRDRAVPEYPL